MANKPPKKDKKDRAAAVHICWQQFRDVFLLLGESFLFASDAAILTKEVLESVRVRFSENPIKMKALSFTDKLKQQFADAPIAEKLCILHVYFLHLLLVEHSSKESELTFFEGLETLSPHFHKDMLLGVCNYGRMSTMKFQHCCFIIDMLLSLELWNNHENCEERILQYCDKHEGEKYAYGICSALRYFIRPDKYESIWAKDEKRQIADHYAKLGYLTDDSAATLDEQIAIIRQNLEREHSHVGFDFYDDDDFNQWRKDSGKASEPAPSYQNSQQETTTMPPKTKPTKISDNINRILYGPPGTGKTYRAIRMALPIADGALTRDDVESMHAEEVVQRFKELQKSGQIAMVTFHQNYSYEDFVEGIKPVLTQDGGNKNGIAYELKGGVFKTIVTNAINSITMKSADKGVIDLIYCFADVVDEKWEDGEAITLPMKRGGQLTISTQRDRYGSLESFKADAGEWHIYIPINYIVKYYPESEAGNQTNRDIAPITGPSKLGHHSHATYIRLLLDKIKECKTEMEYRTNSVGELFSDGPRNFVLIIDEINRGNIAKIFGELITLVEESKRLGNSDELSLTLPYSQEEFGVPNNLYIIGTMNTADRSIALLDTALRRRFHFIEMMPRADKLRDVGNISLERMLAAINQRIHALYDREHQIGHAPLMKVETLDDLKQAFQTYVMPLLQEYFFDDWEKIDLVLNKNGFVQKDPVTVGGEERAIYNVLPADDSKWNDPASYTKIYAAPTTPDDSND